MDTQADETKRNTVKGLPKRQKEQNQKKRK